MRELSPEAQNVNNEWGSRGPLLGFLPRRGRGPLAFLDSFGGEVLLELGDMSSRAANVGALTPPCGREQGRGWQS